MNQNSNHHGEANSFFSSNYNLKEEKKTPRRVKEKRISKIPDDFEFEEGEGS